MRVATLLGILCWPFTALASNQSIEKDALILVKEYIEAHNNHDIPLEISYYDEDAVFILSGNRGRATGHEEIRKLLEFDVAASSNIKPFGLRSESIGDAVVRIDLAGVVEHSDIFRALGFGTVTTDPLKGAFFIRHGKIIEARQPEFRAPCAEELAGGMGLFTGWLKTDLPDIHSILVPNGEFLIRADLIPTWLDALVDWRKATGWAPDDGRVAECSALDAN